MAHEQPQNNLPLSACFPQFARCCQCVVAGTVLALLAGCADLGYVLQSAQGHFGMLQAAKPVDEWLAEPNPPAPLKRQLELAQRMRRFAVTELGLPDNASYTRYADVRRTAAVWNVVAAPKLSLTLKTWCFPVAGCVGYRGYFDEADARAMAAELKAEGLEVSVYGVPAYSTLGWMNWAGGDPLLNTFIHYPDGELARLIFHELAHQVAYAKDDTTFNESFATAVERLGGNRWLAQHGSLAATRQFDANAERRSQFRALTQATRAVLTKTYESNSDKVVSNAESIAIKEIAMSEFRTNYARLRAEWQSRSTAPQNLGFYDNWVVNANNASLGAQAAYDELVPQFEALFLRIEAQSTLPQQSPWPKFYAAVQQLAALPKADRRQALGAAATALPSPPAAQK